MADAADSKSVARKGVWVRLPPPAPLLKIPRSSGWASNVISFAKKQFSPALNRFNLCPGSAVNLDCALCCCSRLLFTLNLEGRRAV